MGSYCSEQYPGRHEGHHRGPEASDRGKDRDRETVPEQIMVKYFNKYILPRKGNELEDASTKWERAHGSPYLMRRARILGVIVKISIRPQSSFIMLLADTSSIFLVALLCSCCWLLFVEQIKNTLPSRNLSEVLLNCELY